MDKQVNWAIKPITKEIYGQYDQGTCKRSYCLQPERFVFTAPNKLLTQEDDKEMLL